MAKIKYDGVIVAAHFNPENRVVWVRAFLRNGAVFSDRVHLDRRDLIERINSGKKFNVGKRIDFEGATFEIYEPLRVVEKNGEFVLLSGDIQAETDRLDGIPKI